MTEQTIDEERIWSEEFDVEVGRLMDHIRAFIAEGNARRIVIRKQDGTELLDLPLPAGLVAGGVLAWYAPVLTVLTVMGGLVTRLRIQVFRRGEQPEG